MTYRVFTLRSLIILSAVISVLTSSLHAQTAEELKTEFVDAFLDVDEARMQQSFDSLSELAPSDPELIPFANELACFYANAAASRPRELSDRGPKAEALFREFYPGGKYASKPGPAGHAQLQHARFLIRTGQENGASLILRGLAEHPSSKIFNEAVKQVVLHTLMTDADVEFWRNAIELRTEGKANVNKTLAEHLSILQNWNRDDIRLNTLERNARIHEDLSEYAFNTGALQVGKDHLRQTKELLDEFFAQLDAGQTTSKTPLELLNLKLALARAEMWLDNDERAGQLIDEIVAQMPTVAPGQGDFQSLVQYWSLIMQERKGEISEETFQANLATLLNQGYCSVPVACKIIDKLAAYEQARGQHATAYGYYRDLAEDLPNPVLVVWAREKMAKVSQDAPELNTMTIAPVIGVSLFASENQKIAEDQTARASQTGLAGPRRFANWRQPQYTGDVAGESRLKRQTEEEPAQP